MKENSGDLFVFTIVLLFIIIYYVRRSRRKRKNIYGFEIEKWSLLKDDALLYEIETQFKNGFIAQALKQSGYVLEDWHSNLIHENQKFITGYIELSLYALGVGTDILTQKRNDISIVPISCKSYRYFIGKVTAPQNHLVNISSETLLQIPQLKMNAIATELNQLERKFGLNNWKFIFYQNYIVVLVPEIWEHSSLLEFVKLCETIYEKLAVAQELKL